MEHFDNVGESHLPLVRLDPRRFEVVLMNVLSNAIKYMPDGAMSPSR